MQNEESVLKPACLDSHSAWGLVPLSHPLHSWVAQLTDFLLPHPWCNRYRKGKFRPVLLSWPQQFTYPGKKKKLCSWPLHLLLCQSDFSVLYPFLSAPPDCPKKEYSFCKRCFSQEEVLPVRLMTAYPGSSFLSHSQTDPCCCSIRRLYAAQLKCTRSGP